MNAYAEPVVSLDLDLVVATDQQASVERVLAAAFEVARFPHPLEGVCAGFGLARPVPDRRGARWGPGETAVIRLDR